MNTTPWPSLLPTGGGGSPYFSSIAGPILSARTWEWASRMTPVTVGTVMVTVDEASNQTVTSTSYHTEHSQYVTSGTFPSSLLYTRTDTNAAGTVTAEIYDGSGTVTVTYPTNYLQVVGSLTWDAILPTFAANGSCCLATQTLSPTPSHTPFPISTGSIDAEDPGGLLYGLTALNNPNVASTEISELFKGQNLEIPYSGCSYAMCGSTSSKSSSISPPPASATFQNPQAYLLATSTTTLSSVGLGGDGGGGTTTTPEPVQQGPTTTAEPDQDSQIGSTPHVTTPPPPPNQGSGTPPSISSDHNSQVGNKPSETPPTQNPNVGTTPGGEPTGQQAPSGSGTSPPTPLAPLMTIRSSAISANSASQYIVGGQTLVPGSAIDVSGTTYRLLPGGSQLVVGTSTTNLMPAVTEPPSGPSGSLPLLTVGDSTVMANSASEYIVGDQTLAPGSAIVVSGTTISLASGASQLVVGSVTATRPSSTAVTTSAESTTAASSSSGTQATQNSASGRVQTSFGRLCLMTVFLLFSMR